VGVCGWVRDDSGELGLFFPLALNFLGLDCVESEVGLVGGRDRTPPLFWVATSTLLLRCLGMLTASNVG
jgi:hypothetical protein